MDIVFLENRDDFERHCSDYKDDCVFVCFDWFTKNLIEKRGKRSFMFDDFVDKALGRRKQQHIDELGEKWFKDETGKNVTLFNNVSMGSTQYLFTRLYFTIYFRFVISFIEIIKKYKPERAFLYTRGDMSNIEDSGLLKKMILETIAKKFDVQFQSLDSSGPQILQYFPITWMRRNSEKLIALKLVMKKLIKITSNLICSVKGVHKKTKVFLYHSPIHSKLWSLYNKDKRQHNFTLILSLVGTPPKNEILNLLLKPCPVFSPRFVRLSREDLAEISSIRNKVENLMKSKHWKKQFNYSGIDFSPVFSEIIRLTFFNRLEAIARKVRSFEKELLRVRADVLIVPDDRVENTRILIELASRLGCKVYYWDHGAAEIYVFYDSLRTTPRITHGILAWGEHMVRGYNRVGVDKEMIKVLTPVFFEKYLPIKKNMCQSRKKALVLNHIKTKAHLNGKEDIEWFYLHNVCNILQSLNVEEIKLKIHPGRANLTYFKELIDAMNLDIDVCYGGDFMDYVKWADFVVGPSTTGLLEALMCGKNVYPVDFEDLEMNGLLNQKEDKLFYLAGSSEQLRYMISNNFEQPRDGILGVYLGVDKSTEKGELYEKFVDFLNSI